MTLTWLLTLAVSPNSIEQMRVEIQCLETHGWLPTDKHWIQEIEFMLVASRQRIAMMSENIHACITEFLWIELIAANAWVWKLMNSSHGIPILQVTQRKCLLA